MKNKRIIIPIIIGIAVIIFLVICFIFKNKSIDGTWIVDYYITDSGNIKQEDIGEYYGTDFQKMYSTFSVEFKNGKAIINLPSTSGSKEERNCDYEVKGKEIYLTAEGETIKAFEIKGDSLIVYSIANLDGNAALKKK
ncbi:hypothetical protein [Roseburia sp. MSJ-14]|uniref:hypothetical protein n=1 Tax=Roseburia sp. MSJ-14 TaxID=2841514 RepID=UPI001C10AB6E|nr:hypothetical protein [Roseburia sp. MSJ-14]MBU5473948.1 hypothetical protein [Roseburia sp. MSJ-14]